MSKSFVIDFRHAYVSLIFFLWLHLALPDPSLSQVHPSGSSNITRDTLQLSGLSRTHQLSCQFLIPESDTITTNDPTIFLERGKNYKINYRHGTVTIDSITFGALKSKLTHLYVYYHFLPFQFQSKYSRRTLVALPDTLNKDTVRVAQPRARFNIDEIFGSNLQKSGSIVRGITVGSNRDFSLNSGLRLQLSGKLTSDVDVVASLTDENTPIQPEGTTQTLQEFDKVFVEFRGPSFDAVLGDFNIDLAGSEFGRLNRKLQGGKGSVRYDSDIANGSVMVSGAIPRGKFHSNQIQGIEAVQGPYQLVGRNNERAIIIIAGTERVYVNGEQMVRGETNDYTIDYSSGEVTFTTRRLITAASRIVVDFEYTDRQFSRSFFATGASADFLDDKLNLGFSFIREADDQNEPIELVLTDSIRQILSTSGDSREEAFISGITEVDSNGFYVRIDTVFNGNPYQYYVYAPGTLARYVISFSFVGSGRGEYVRQSAGVFVWNGIGNGDYLPIKFLPLPQAHHVMDYTLKAQPLKELSVTGEFAQSLFDPNRFSSLGDHDNSGHAFHLAASYSPKDIDAFGVRLGSAVFSLKERFVNKQFLPLDRVNDIEFSRKWGIDSLSLANEEIREFSSSYLPSPSATISFGTGSYRRGDDLHSSRREGSLRVLGEHLPTVTYFLEDIESDDSSQRISSAWRRHKGAVGYLAWKITPSARFEVENRRLEEYQGGGLKPGSFWFDVFAPGIRFDDKDLFSLSAEYEWRRDDLFHGTAAVLARESNSFTHSYHAALKSGGPFSSVADVTIRNKEVTPLFEGLGNSDLKTVLLRNQSRFSPASRAIDIDVFYEVATERSSSLRRVFVKVAPGSGNYKYIGDINNNSIAEDSEFEQTRFDGDFVAITLTSEDLLPIIDLKTSVRVRFSPKPFVGESKGWLARTASLLSTETYVRVDEKSTERDLKQIYLLHFSKFRRDSTTISGTSLFTQDLHLLEGTPEFSMRLRFSERQLLARFSAGLEKGYAREQSIRVRLQPVKEFSQQIDYVRKTDRGSNTDLTSRNRDIISNSLIFDLSYRPEQNIETGLKTEVTNSLDRFPTMPVAVDINAQSLRTTYAFQGSGQVRAEVAREEVTGAANLEFLPYELTGGRVAGKTWLWRAAIDYRIAQFLQATMTYDGRAEAGRSIVHTGRAEVRAFF